MVHRAGSKPQSRRGCVRRPRRSYVPSPGTALRIAGRFFALRYHERTADWLIAAAASSEGPEGREFGRTSPLTPILRRIEATTPSVSTFCGVAEKAMSSGARRQLQRLVRNGVASDPGGPGHHGRRKAAATPLIYSDRTGRCRHNLVEWTKARLHATVRRSAQRI